MKMLCSNCYKEISRVKGQLMNTPNGKKFFCDKCAAVISLKASKKNNSERR